MCKDYSEDQNIEMGEYITWNGTDVLRPFGKYTYKLENNQKNIHTHVLAQVVAL